MKIKKMIFLLITLIFLYLISWHNFGYEPEKPFNRPYFTGLIKIENSETRLTYVYDTDTFSIDREYNIEEVKKNIKPKNIIIKTINIFGVEKTAAKKIILL